MVGGSGPAVIPACSFWVLEGFSSTDEEDECGYAFGIEWREMRHPQLVWINVDVFSAVQRPWILGTRKLTRSLERLFAFIPSWAMAFWRESIWRLSKWNLNGRVFHFPRRLSYLSSIVVCAFPRTIGPIWCFNGLIVELKAVNALAGHDAAQLLNYLKVSGLEKGLLLNFGSVKLEFKRMVW